MERDFAPINKEGQTGGQRSGEFGTQSRCAELERNMRNGDGSGQRRRENAGHSKQGMPKRGRHNYARAGAWKGHGLVDVSVPRVARPRRGRAGKGRGKTWPSGWTSQGRRTQTRCGRWAATEKKTTRQRHAARGGGNRAKNKENS
ncbi:hypothetical protein, conserved in T. vivax, partial [Trypanosoma vivax Y486]